MVTAVTGCPMRGPEGGVHVDEFILYPVMPPEIETGVPSSLRPTKPIGWDKLYWLGVFVVEMVVPSGKVPTTVEFC